MVHASLFSGIGGFDLAAEWCGWENSFQCEINDFCQLVLAKNFPHADRHTDIKGFDARRYRGTVDVLSGGFPCQPFSLAGQRKGNSDDRALWPEMLRVIDEVRPRWIVGENVAGLASLGLDGVLFDLEASGYACQTVLLPAAGVGAPHRRDRLWIIAHADSLLPHGSGRERHGRPELADSGCHAAAHAQSERLQRHGADRDAGSIEPNKGAVCSCAGAGLSLAGNPDSIIKTYGHAKPEPNGTGQPSGRCVAGNWENWPTEPAFCGRDDGLPAGLVRVSTRAKQLKAYGNSIVPQVAYEIFQAIQLIDTP